MSKHSHPNDHEKKNQTIHEIPKHKLPKHIGIILDGNTRWAKNNHKLNLGSGHLAGLQAVRDLLQYCSKYAIETLSLFIFSSENWKRPKNEVNYLFQLLFSTIKSDIKLLNKHDIKLKIIGNINVLNSALQRLLLEAQTLTYNNQTYTLVLAINYGGRWDILETTKHLIRKVQKNEIAIEEINTEMFSSHLSTAHLPELDLLIRTSGENRLSNFMLWQSAYAELYFTDTLWPDFNEITFQHALINYASRQRRFGNQIKSEAHHHAPA
ncbi:MAG: di-trans,poly-cis-decaprenylcistransferase [Endozoicomonadaceae bacterium]|nr:di-trans,poly-cis-decaprenylcistransferase [Endozoicomonadaceae bacterium]